MQPRNVSYATDEAEIWTHDATKYRHAAREHLLQLLA